MTLRNREAISIRLPKTLEIRTVAVYRAQGVIYQNHVRIKVCCTRQGDSASLTPRKVNSSFWFKCNGVESIAAFGQGNQLDIPPISVSMPSWNVLTSCSRAQAYITFCNLTSSSSCPKRMFSFRLAFWIQAFWVTRPIFPPKHTCPRVCRMSPTRPCNRADFPLPIRPKMQTKAP